MVIGMVMLWCGLPAAALPLFELAEQMTRTDHSLWGRIAIRIQHSYAELELGRRPDRAILQRSLAAVEVARDPRNAAHLHRLLALISVAKRPDEARFHLERAIVNFERAGAVGYAYACYAQLAQLNVMAGDHAAAADAAAHLDLTPEAFWITYDLADAVLTALHLPADLRPVNAATLQQNAVDAIMGFARQLPDGLRSLFLSRPSHQALLSNNG